MPQQVTARDLIQGALKMIGIVGQGVTMSGEQAVEGFRVLNDMMDGFKTQRLTAYHTPREVFSLLPNVASYTIGLTGDINTQRPMWISEAGLILDDTADPPIEVPIPVLNAQAWAQVRAKALTGNLVQAVYYDHAWSQAAGLGNIYVTPIPTVSTLDLVLYLPKMMDEFTSLSTVYTFPPGYRRMFRSNLAVELAPDYNVPVSGELMKIAMDSLKWLKAANMQFNVLKMPRPLLVTYARRHMWRNIRY